MTEKVRKLTISEIMQKFPEIAVAINNRKKLLDESVHRENVYRSLLNEHIQVEQVLRKAFEDINNNIGEWFQGDKYIHGSCNNGEGFVSDCECIIGNTMIEIRKIIERSLND